MSTLRSMCSILSSYSGAGHNLRLIQCQTKLWVIMQAVASRCNRPADSLPLLPPLLPPLPWPAGS